MNNEKANLAISIKEHFEALDYVVEVDNINDDKSIKVIDTSWKPSLVVDVCITTLEEEITFVTVICGYQSPADFQGPLDSSDVEEILQTISEHLI